MVRETRYLWVGSLPESIAEDQICDHFSSYGKIQSVKLVPQQEPDDRPSAIVAFMDIKSASKAHNSENIISGVTVVTHYNESSAAVNTSARIQDCVNQKSVPPGTCGQLQVSSGVLQQSLHSGRSQQRADGLSEDFAEARISDSVELRDAGKTSERSQGRGSGGESEKDRSRPSRPYHSSNNSYLPSHKSRLESHTVQGSKGNETRRRNGKGFDGGGGHRSSRTRSTSRSTGGRSQSQDSSGSGSQSLGQSGEKKLSSVVQLPGQASGSSMKSDDQQSDKPRGLLITGIPVRSSDSNVREGLFHDYKKYSRLMSITIEGQGESRCAVVSFKKHEDAAKALDDSKEKVFFGAKIIVTPHQGYEIDGSELHSTEVESNEFSHKATKTLYIGNLEKSTTKDHLRDIFSKFGFIIEVDIKSQGQVLSFGFVQFDNIRSVVTALRDMEDKYISGSKVKLGFGKPIPSDCVWVEGISDTVSEKYLATQFNKFGRVLTTYIDRRTGRALVYYDTQEQAVIAVNEMRGKYVAERKIQIDFASPDCRNIFLESLESSGQLRPGDRPDDRAARGCHPFAGQEFLKQRPGYEGFQPRGGRFNGCEGHIRGSYNGSRDAYFPSVVNRVGTRSGCYETFPHDRRDGLNFRGTVPKYFESHSDADPVFYDSYEVALKEYGHSRRDRESSPSLERHRSYRTGVGDSPRSSRYGSPGRERLDETFTYRYGDGKTASTDLGFETRKEGHAGAKQGHRGFSPANSDFSQKSKRHTHRDSRSVSPVSVKQRSRKDRSSSPANKDSLWNSSTDEIGYHVTSRRASKESPDCYIYSEKPGKGSTYGKCYGHSGSRNSKSRSSRCDEDSDVLSDRDRSARGLDPAPRTKALRSVDEQGVRQRTAAIPTDAERQKKLEMEISISCNLIGYQVGDFSRDYGDENQYCDGRQLLSSKVDLPGAAHRHSASQGNQALTSGSTTPGSRTPLNNSDQDSAGGRNSHGSDEVMVLEKRKEQLLSLLKQIEEGDSDNNVQDDGKKDTKCIVVDDSDVEIDKSAEFRNNDEFYCNIDIPTERKNSGNVFDSEQIQNEIPVPHKTGKTKPIDATKSFRKQMEEQRKSDLESLSSSSSPVSQTRPNRPTSMSCQDPMDSEDPYGVCNSPTEIPKDFLPAKCHNVSGDASSKSPAAKHKRTYRPKLSDGLFNSSSEEELGEFSPSSSQHSRHWTVPDEVCDDAGVVEKSTRIVSLESLWSGDEMSKCHLPVFRRHPRRCSGDVQSEYLPCIIPDAPVITKSSDGLGPQEPRKGISLCSREVLDLPLPRFAAEVLAAKSPASAVKATTTPPAVVNKSLEISHKDAGNKEPPVSPNLASSPAFDRSKVSNAENDKVCDNIADNTVHKLEVDNSGLGSCELSGSTVNENKDDVVGGICPPSTHDLSEKCVSEASTSLAVDTVPECVDGADGVAAAEDSGKISSDVVNVVQGVVKLEEISTNTEKEVEALEPVKADATVEAESKDETEHNDAKSESIQPDQKPDESLKDVSSVKDPICEDNRTASKQNASDSDISDLLSPTPSIPSLEERIRALDEKLNQMQQNSKQCVGEVSSSSAAPPASFDYREKYVRRRKEAPGRLPSQTENRNEVSAVARTLLSRTSIFDQDSQRLEQLQAKYDPSAAPSGFARQPDTEAYSSLYTPLYRGAVGMGGKDGTLTQSSTPDGFVCSSPGMINSAIHSSVPSVAWNHSSSSGQQISMTTTWPSPMATTPSPLSVVISPNLTFGQLPTPSWMSPALPNQSGYGAVRGPMVESLPAGARMPLFFHQTGFEGSRAPGNTPPYSGGPNPSYQSHISGGDPRRLSRPDMCAVSPLMSSGILKRQSSHSSDVDLWSNVKPDAVLPAKTKEIISPVSILKRPIKEETPKDALSTGDASLNPAALDATSVAVSGVKRKPDSAFGTEANFCEGKPSGQSKNLKLNQATTKYETVTVKSEKGADDKTLDVKSHSSSSVIGQHARVCGEIKRTPCSMGSPKPCPAKVEEKRSAELPSAKKWEDANKVQARKTPKPSVGSSQGEKLDYAKKDCRARIMSESSETASVDPVAGNQSKDKLGKLVKTKVVGKDSLEKLDRDREKDKDKDKDQHKEKDKEKSVQDQGSDNRAKDKMHGKPKTPEVKAPFKAKEGRDDESKKECLTPLEQSKDDGKKDKTVGSALKSGCGKERTMPAEFGKDDSKKLKATNRDSSKDSVKRNQSSSGDVLSSAKSITDSESKGHKPVKAKTEKSSSKQPKVGGGDSSEISVKNGKPSSSAKPVTNERRDSKDSNRSNRPSGQKTSNSGSTNSVLKQPSSEHKGGSHSNKEREKDGNKVVMKKRTGESVKTERRSDQSKKKDKKVEKPKEKRPEEKREVKALMQKFLNSDSLSTGYVSMYDMVKRRSSKEGGKDCFQSLDNRSKSLSQLQAKKNQRNRSKQSIGSSILDSDEDESFRDDSLNLKSERSRKKPSTESRSKNWINSTSSSLSSDDEEVGKSSRVALKSGKGLNDNSSSDVSIDEFSLSAKSKTNNTKPSKPRQSIYTSSSESDSDMDSKFDKQVTSTPYLVKSKPVGDAGVGKSQKKGSELMGRKGKLFSRSKPIARSLQTFSPSDVDDDDDVDDTDNDADEDSSAIAKLQNESQNRNESSVANVLDPTAAVASKKRSLLSEVSVLKKNETEMDSSENLNKTKKVLKPSAITVKENTSPSKPRETLPSTKNEIKSKTKTEVSKKDVSIHPAETNDESAKKERHQEVIVGPKEKDKSHSQSKSDVAQKRNISDSKASKCFDKVMASDSFDKSVKRQKLKSDQEISSRNDAPSKSEASLRNELERGNKTIRDSCEKLIKRPKLEIKSGGKSFEDEESILMVAKSVVGKTTEKLETGGEDLNANLRSDNIFEKMEMKEESGRIGICSETSSVNKSSEAVSLGLEKQYSTISDTTTAPLDEEDGSLTIQVHEPVESSRLVVKEVDAAKLTVEKMKQDATKEEAIAEAVKAIMDLGREELGREEQRKSSEHNHHEENVVVMDVVDHNDTGVCAGEVNCPEVSSDDSDELTQAIQSLIGKELEPDVEEPVEEEEVQLEDVVSQPELDENKPEDVENENNAEEVYNEVVPECHAGDEFAETKIEIKHVQEESEKNVPENGENLKETVKVEIMESSVTDATESKQSVAFEASSVFVEPKPLVEKEGLVGGEKDSDPDSVDVTDLQSKRTKVDPNKSMGDSAYFAGYFSPFPCIPIPKDEVEEQNSVVKMESIANPETAVSKSPALAAVAAVAAADCGEDVMPETAGKANDSTEVDLLNETCVEPLKKEEEPCEDKNKDLYEFKDEEEKMITDFVPARPRKRSGEGEANGAADTQVRAKKPKLESADEVSGSAVVTSESPSRDDSKMIPASSSVPVGTSTASAEAAQCMLSLSLATSVPKPVTDPTPVPALSLPIVTTTTAPPPLTWQTNMDKIIDEVAKGNFDRGCDFNYYNAKKPPRSKSREEPVPLAAPSGNLPVHPDIAKQHMIMAAPGFLQMPAAGGAGIPRSDTSSLHHLPFYNAGAAAARQLVSQPQIVMLSSDKTSPRLTSPLVQNQAPFRPPSTLYQALVSSAANVQQSGLLFCAPPVGYQLAPTGLAVSHSDSSVIPMHRFLGPRDDLPHSLHGSQVHQMTSSMSTRGVEKLVNLPNQLRPGHEAQQQGMGMPRQGVNLHGQQELSHPGARVMPTMMSHGVLLAHNPSSVSQNQTTPHNEQHHLSIQQQAHLQAHQHQQQKHSETMPVATSATPGQSHGRPEYLYRQVTPSSQVKFEGVPAALGIVSLEPGMFRQMSPKISDSLLQSLPRQPGALVAHFGNYPQSVQYGMMLPHASLSNTKDPSSSVPSSSSAQSELREALAQPSRLVQQEQLIQQQQQNVLQVRPHNLPDLCPSPVTLGQHRMPFAIQEPRSNSTSRAEPKSAGVVDSPAPLPGGPPMSLIQPFCDPSAGSHVSAADKNALGMVETKPSGQQTYKTNPRFQMLQYDQGLARGIALDARQLEQLMLSKEVMSSPQIVAQHHLMVSGQMPPPQQQQQQPSMSLFSHPDLAVGRPPSVHHLPASSLSAQQGHIARPSPDHSESIAQLLTRFPVMWNGVLELKNDRAPVQMHFISGNRTLVPASLQDSGKPLHIGQRMRLEAAQLEQVLRRMMNESEYSMLVAVPCGSDPVTMMTAAHSLQNGFIRYLQEKQAAGIVNIYQPSTNQATYVIHIFPPCEFSMTNLSRFTQDIVQHTTDANFLLIIITTC